MSSRVPARPQEAVSTPARRTSTPLPVLTLPQLSLETPRSWRSSSRIWIKCWRRCEKWFCWQVWRGRPTADEPRAFLTHPLLMCLCHTLPMWATALPCRAAPCRGSAAPAASGDWSSSSGPGSWAVLVAGPCSAPCASRTLPA